MITPQITIRAKRDSVYFIVGLLIIQGDDEMGNLEEAYDRWYAGECDEQIYSPRG